MELQVIIFSKDRACQTLSAMVAAAQYEWIALLDVDDWWEPSKLEKQAQFLGKYDVIGTHCQYFGELTGSPNIPAGPIHPDEFRRHNRIINSSAVLRKADACWDPEYSLLYDYDLWVRLNAKGRSFYNLKEKLTHHRIHQASCYNSSVGQKLQRLRLCKERNLIP
ncbi:glycosyltransferase [Pseudomonadota bacterium]